MTKITDSDKNLIKSLKNKGFSVVEIAEKFNVTRYTIYNHLKSNENVEFLENDLFYIGIISSGVNLNVEFLENIYIKEWYEKFLGFPFEERISTKLKKIIDSLEFSDSMLVEFYEGFLYGLSIKNNWKLRTLKQDHVFNNYLDITKSNLLFFDRGYGRIQLSDFSRDKIFWKIYYGEWVNDPALIMGFYESLYQDELRNIRTLPKLFH